MPLMHGKSPHVISSNIAELRSAGHPEAQAVAIAEHVAQRGTPHPKSRVPLPIKKAAMPKQPMLSPADDPDEGEMALPVKRAVPPMRPARGRP